MIFNGQNINDGKLLTYGKDWYKQLK